MLQFKSNQRRAFSEIMAPPALRKRKIEDAMKGKVARPKKKIRKQSAYHSSSSEDEAPDEISGVNLQDSDSDNEGSPAAPVISQQKETRPKKSNKRKQTSDDEKSQPEEDDEDSDASSASSHSASSIASSNPTSTISGKKISKRNDPTAFSTSISKILSTKLPSSARADPLLSRSKTAVETSADIANEKLEKRARAKLRADKKEALERDRIRDVRGIERGETGETAEREKRLRKVAQRGVVKLFNAVRAAQVRGQEVANEERKKRSIVGMGEREKAVNEVSKQGFLDLINGKDGKKMNIEEA